MTGRDGARTGRAWVRAALGNGGAHLVSAAAAAATAGLLTFTARPACAITRTWTGGATGFNTSWNGSSNWNPAGVPAQGDVVSIPSLASGVDTNVVYDYPGNVVLGALTLNHNNAPGLFATSILTMSGNTLYANSQLLGDSSAGGSRGRGRIAQSGGSNTAPVLTLGKLASNVGSYDLSGAGFLHTSDARIGEAGLGFFTQSGGTHEATTLAIGNLAGGNGTYTLSAGQLTADAVLVGNAGSGTFNFSGGTLSAAAITVGSSGLGTMNVSNGADVNASVAYGSMVVGRNAGSSGTVNVSGANSRLRVPFGLTIGESGAGTLNLTGGGIATTDGHVRIGQHSGSSGAVIVDGAGSRWTIASESQFSNNLLEVGVSGAGALDVSNGGEVQCIKMTVGSAGIVQVSHPTSLLRPQEDVAVSTGGALELSAGGLLTKSTYSFFPPDLTAQGAVTVQGLGSRLHWAGDFRVDGGTVSVTSGGHLQTSDGTSGSSFPSPSGSIYASAGLTGAVLVDGSGSQWTHGSSIGIGNLGGGNGRLTITNGGYASSASAFIGGYNGTVVVDGAGSLWSVGELGIAYTGSGALALVNGGAVNVAGGVQMSGGGGSSTLNILSGGTLTVGGDITRGGPLWMLGTSAILLDGGTLDLQNHAIGGIDPVDGPVPIDQLRFRSGTLKNVAEINSGAGLTKTHAGTLMLDGTNTYTGVTTVSQGTLIFKTSYTSGAGIAIEDGATARLDSSAATPNNVTLKAPLLSIAATGQLDLVDNKLIAAGGDVGTSDGTTYSGLSGLIQSGRNGGTWDGGGIITSMPAAQGTLTTLGIKTAEAAGTFGGVSVSAGDVLIMYTYGGDANLDGFVSGDDYTAIDFAIAVPNASGWVNGDFNYDGFLSGDDYTIIDFNIAAQGTAFPTNGAAGSTAVPEPAGALMLIAAGWALSATTLARRTRRRR